MHAIHLIRNGKQAISRLPTDLELRERRDFRPGTEEVGGSGRATHESWLVILFLVPAKTSPL